MKKAEDNLYNFTDNIQKWNNEIICPSCMFKYN